MEDQRGYVTLSMTTIRVSADDYVPFNKPSIDYIYGSFYFCRNVAFIFYFIFLSLAFVSQESCFLGIFGERILRGQADVEPCG